MRIIAGKHKSRMLQTPSSTRVRPTTDRTREALFNILSNRKTLPFLEGSYVLDCFAGSGALGLEALSRGAKHVTFIEHYHPAWIALEHNRRALGEILQTTLLKEDALKAPEAPFPCDFVFLDPPYGKDLVVEALKQLLSQGWIKETTICIAEVGKKETILNLPPEFVIIEERIYGATHLIFLQRTP